MICTYLSALLLAGLVLNALAGWWWADPLAALAMLPLIGKALSAYVVIRRAPTIAAQCQGLHNTQLLLPPQTL